MFKHKLSIPSHNWTIFGESGLRLEGGRIQHLAFLEIDIFVDTASVINLE